MMSGAALMRCLLVGALLLSPACTASRGPAVVPIAEVQGVGQASPMAGRTVTVEGVVVGGSVAGLGGFFVQDPEGDADGRASDGLFVEVEPGTVDPQRFERVRVTGQVGETGTEPGTVTTLHSATVKLLGGRRELAPVIVDEVPPDWEPLEGMYVRIDAPLTVSGTGGLPRFGEIVASFDGRLMVPTEMAPPGEASRRLAIENRRRTLVLDDADTRPIERMPWWIEDVLSPETPLRAGSVIRAVTGVVDQRRGQTRLQVIEEVSTIDQGTRPRPVDVPGDTRIAGFNVLNLFNGDGAGGGFPTPRGAATQEDFALQQQKLVASIQALAPDVAALMEIENDGYGAESALARFTDALNAAGPATDYRFVSGMDGPGTDAIRVALVYRAGRVQPVGQAAASVDGPFAWGSRPPLAQAFRRGDGPPFVVVANHFKSKSCGRGDSAASGPEADQQDGQSCWNPWRVESARHVHAWLQTDPTGTGTDLVALIGDFNAYAQEEPIRVLLENGWHDALAPSSGPRPYTYVYNGEAGRLDHALLSGGLAARLAGARVWHSNADEVPLFGYESGIDTSAYRASDHDPILLGLELGER